MGAIIFNVILLIVFSVLLKTSFGIEDLREVDPFGAAGFPKMILLILVPLLLISLYKSIQDYLKDKKQEKEPSISIKKPTIITIIIIVLLALFISLLDIVGFLIASFMLTPLLLVVLGEKNKTRLILLSILTPIILTGLFGVILDIPLPRGIGIFLEISRLIY